MDELSLFISDICIKICYILMLDLNVYDEKINIKRYLQKFFWLRCVGEYFSDIFVENNGCNSS